MGVEAMFKDCKTGGYNLEGSKANVQGLTNKTYAKTVIVV